MNKKIILVLFIAGICQTAFGEVLLSNDVFKKVPFSSQYSEDGSLIRSIHFRSVNDLIPQLEEQFKDLLDGQRLQDRNESHITVITPPEGKTGFFPGSVGTDRVLPTGQMIDMYKGSIQDTSFAIECVGMQKSSNGSIVFYLVVESNDILNIRKEIYNIVSPDSTIPFHPTNEYYPHITIGFIGGDVFVDDEGEKVSKGKDTCVSDLRYF